MIDKCYTSDGILMVPDVKLHEPHDAYTYIPLRGYAYTMAVKLDGRCIGWILAETLGFDSVKEYVNHKNSNADLSASR